MKRNRAKQYPRPLIRGKLTWRAKHPKYAARSQQTRGYEVLLFMGHVKLTPSRTHVLTSSPEEGKICRWYTSSWDKDKDPEAYDLPPFSGVSFKT